MKYLLLLVVLALAGCGTLKGLTSDASDLFQAIDNSLATPE
ncbi:hypothetical protein LCGC14_1146220 [marine sediment metagenome]|uniref:Uncharacterized protein n=1 Tax=marine sediment metagenome TaxID=412755 RepID=A0A0F9Q2H9_9ZZZZ